MTFLDVCIHSLCCLIRSALIWSLPAWATFVTFTPFLPLPADVGLLFGYFICVPPLALPAVCISYPRMIPALPAAKPDYAGSEVAPEVGVGAWAVRNKRFVSFCSNGYLRRQKYGAAYSAPIHYFARLLQPHFFVSSSLLVLNQSVCGGAVSVVWDAPQGFSLSTNSQVISHPDNFTFWTHVLLPQRTSPCILLWFSLHPLPLSLCFQVSNREASATMSILAVLTLAPPWMEPLAPDPVFTGQQPGEARKVKGKAGATRGDGEARARGSEGQA